MNSLVKSAKWPSYDSLSSPTSLLLSESEHTEDEADLHSSEGEGESGGGSKLFSPGRGSGAAVFSFPGRSSSCKERYCKSRPAKSSPAAQGPPAGAVGLGSFTPGDVAFAQKCADLQKFARPLFELLSGLKTGRFEKGLTGFQQSVAIDRLQRILGILKKPDMGEKYLRTLLQVEILLRMWFPQMVPQSSVTPTHGRTTSGSYRQRQNQLHIPVKKRKMSWLNPDPSDTVLPQHQPGKRHQSADLRDFCQTSTSNNAISTRQHGTSTQKRDVEETTPGPHAHKLTDCSAAVDDRRHSCSRRENGARRVLHSSLPPPSLRGLSTTQDGSVSSSSAIPVPDSP